MEHSRSLLPYCAAFLLCSASMQAGAEERPQVINSGPVTACQSALPVFDGNIRKRPLAVANEGPSNAFVTCSFSTIGPHLANLVAAYELSVSNAGPDNDIDITCTGVGGVQGGTGARAPQAVTLTATLDSGGKQTLAYVPEQFLNDVLPNFFSVSCNLPPGTSVNDMQVFIDEAIDPP